MCGHSCAIGSFTFMIMSARFQTSAAVSTICAPKLVYRLSSKPLPAPAFFSTSTVCPALTSASAPPGTSAMRFSFVLISLGTPMIMIYSRCYFRSPHPPHYSTTPLLPYSLWSQPQHDLLFRIEILRGQRIDIVVRDRVDSLHQLIDRQIRLIVQCRARQSV